MDQDKQQNAPDSRPFANSERASDEEVARLAGGSAMKPASPGASVPSGGTEHEADPHPFATSEQATPEEVAERAAHGPSHLNEGDR
ncbi:MAG: hypothetical protein M3O34_05595 [Chloroflexota bacterium]|nr:hypothetical protein [Chloroflexota bacterium]